MNLKQRIKKVEREFDKRFPTNEMHAILKKHYKPHCVGYLQASHDLHGLLEQHLADELARKKKKG